MTATPSQAAGAPATDSVLSDYGPFPVAAEPDIVDSLVQDIRDGRYGVERVVHDYEDAIGDAERAREVAELLEKHIANQGAGLDLGLLIKVLYFAGRQSLLRKYALKFPAYNILEQFFEGSVVPQGPRLDVPPKYPHGQWTLFGKKIGFPIGIPASVLTNNFEWVQYFYNAGFCVLTTRTVRSRPHDANPSPNWVFASSIGQPWGLDNPVPPVPSMPHVTADLSDWVDAGSSDVSTCNSFGVPSVEPAVWMNDLRRSMAHIQPGQILIASVMGDVYERDLDDAAVMVELQDDFVRVARMAESCGVEHIELNLSCPNGLAEDLIDGVKPPLCYDISRTVAVIKAVRQALTRDTKLVAKLSYMPEDSLGELLAQVGHLLDGVAGINTIPAQVTTKDGTPTFGTRAVAGVSGVAVRNYGLDFVRSLVKVRMRLGLNYEVLGMGGVTDEGSFREMYEAGASAVMSASGAFANPFLADQCIRNFGDRLSNRDTATRDPELMREVTSLVLESMKAGEEVDEYDLAIRLALPGHQALAAVRMLIELGVIERRAGRRLTVA